MMQEPDPGTPGTHEAGDRTNPGTEGNSGTVCVSLFSGE
jgi:hypothetical protein